MLHKFNVDWNPELGVREQFADLEVNLGRFEPLVMTLGDVFDAIFKVIQQRTKYPDLFPLGEIYQLLQGPNPRLEVSLFRDGERFPVGLSDPFACTPWSKTVPRCNKYLWNEDTPSLLFDPRTTLTFSMKVPSSEFPTWLKIVIPIGVVVLLVLLFGMLRSRQPATGANTTTGSRPRRS
jgi:hypothetical protein